ncbi:MAG: patatin-like phospholipase family protein [Alphaproteobacteria bacterium]|nr:patatin-like phospholipase family protein [Alphaproteobacteria bacterium]
MSKVQPKPNGAANGGVKRINLALQGGGSHGAFTWGVLDRLLEDPHIEIEAITGASAGAVNAVVLADGMATGDKEHARRTLSKFWHAISDAGKYGPLRRTPFEALRGGWSLDSSPAYLWIDMLSRVASPYDLNPFNANPLRDLLKKHVDFDRVRASMLKLFVSATNVETGRTKVFQSKELEVDHVLASACLPFMFQSVIIDGTPYWDGGYMGNPPLWPLFEHSSSDDVMLVQINPIRRMGVPRTARDILNRVNEITFNASLLRELRTIDFVTNLMEEGRLEGTGYRRVLVHMVEDELSLSALGASSKMNTEHEFLDMLFAKGRAAAERWISTNADDLGKKSTLDIRNLFQGDDDALDGARIKRQAVYRHSGARMQPKTQGETQ